MLIKLQTLLSVKSNVTQFDVYVFLSLLHWYTKLYIYIYTLAY